MTSTRSADAVEQRVLPRRPAGLRIDVAGENPLGAEGRRRNGQNPRAGTYIEDAPGRGRSGEKFRQHLQAKPGGAVRAGTEGHPRIEFDHRFAGVPADNLPTSA